ncbi:YneF family protein [Bacillus cereus]
MSRVLMQMGQKPSQKKINQMMSAMNKQQMK